MSKLFGMTGLELPTTDWLKLLNAYNWFLNIPVSAVLLIFAGIFAAVVVSYWACEKYRTLKLLIKRWQERRNIWYYDSAQL
jgi:hypothetical protein